MSKRIIFSNIILLFIVCICNIKIFAEPIKIDKNFKVTTSIYEGIRVIEDVKLTFKNTDDIIIGNMYNNTCSGIEILNGKKLTICLENSGNINIYGGCYQEMGNKYSCAGIYVPKDSTLVIEGDGKGVLTAQGYIRAAGIGGLGVAIYGCDTDCSYINAGSIYIKNGNIVANSFCGQWDNFNEGTGAGIGGGGIYNTVDKKVLKGGSVKLVDIKNGNVTAMGGNNVNSNGTGAGIGGGGICNVAKSVDYIKGGELEDIRIQDGKIIALAGSNNNTKGMGAGIGGGGIYNTGECKKIEEGRIINVEKKVQVKLSAIGGYNESVEIGSGSIFSNEVCIKGNETTINIGNTKSDIIETLNGSKRKIFWSIVMTVTGILIRISK